ELQVCLESRRGLFRSRCRSLTFDVRGAKFPRRRAGWCRIRPNVSAIVAATRWRQTELSCEGSERMRFSSLLFEKLGVKLHFGLRSEERRVGSAWRCVS